MINLEDYVDQEVVIVIGNSNKTHMHIGKVGNHLDPLYGRYFFVAGYHLSKSGRNLNGDSRIIEIHRLVPKLIGLAQKAPNIDLMQFVGKKVLVKYNNNNVSIGRVEKYDNGHLCSFNIGVGGTSFTYKGNGIGRFSSKSILEIYEEGAYQLFTSSIPEPENKKMNELAEQIKELNETELAELFKIIKEP